MLGGDFHEQVAHTSTSPFQFAAGSNLPSGEKAMHSTLAHGCCGC